MRKTHSRRRRTSRPWLFVIALAVVAVATGAVIAFAQAAQMDPPTVLPGAGATIDVSWAVVTPVPGTTNTTYTLSWDTTFPFTATQSVTTIDTSYVIHGVDGMTYYAIIQADDGSGVLSPPSNDPSLSGANATADGVAPVSTFVVDPASVAGLHGWYTDATATISVVETNSGLAALSVNAADVSGDPAFVLGVGVPSVYTLPLAQGVNHYTFFGTDNAGNVEAPSVEATLQLDSVIPTSAVGVSSSGPTSQPITVTMTAGDPSPGSGVDHIEYAFLARGTVPSGGTAWTSASGASTSTAAPEGRLTVWVRSVDVAGNMSDVHSADVFFDATAPLTSVVTVPSVPTGPGGTWLAAPGITLSVVDADPNTTTYYSWNNANTIATVGNTPVMPAGSGIQTLRYFSVDTAGNRETTRTATFAISQFTITPTQGSHGTVSPTTAQVVTAGSDSTFTITPDAGYLISSVLVDTVPVVGSPSSYTFHNVLSNHTITATFSPSSYTITASAGSHGAIDPTGAHGVAAGADSTFTITPDVGYHIVDVFVDTIPQGPLTTYTFHNVQSDHSISVTFAIDTFTITKTASAGGSVTGTATVDYGSNATFTITPELGFHIVSVAADGVPQGAVGTYTFTNVVANHSIAATFSIDTFTVTALATLNGTITPPGVSAVNTGSDSDTYTITPNAGYAIADVFVDDVSQGAITTYKFLNVTTNHTISALFKHVTRLDNLASRTVATGGRRVTYHGTMHPNVPNGTHIVVQIRRSGSATWTTKSTRHTTSSRWSYTLSTRGMRHGTYYVRASFGGSATLMPCMSAQRKLIVR
jgi:hypothetical protein